ncbi:hypothetical protein H696_02001 [Fonticula alba]|uniref:Uncharacterized protein n=1 Tax=Fonticula alba TaxID=691883 RepID=A0A058ZAT8_FONAL|nr:hypothetical protein H696_02001 [Fonticula alba]KCV71051.1 hypothetical protein H696_02001 [Fonticula alba]|eukprot:XP_009494174.1 hypothetical protein H696_02001 [Fonticula alba]
MEASRPSSVRRTAPAADDRATEPPRDLGAVPQDAADLERLATFVHSASPADQSASLTAVSDLNAQLAGLQPIAPPPAGTIDQPAAARAAVDPAVDLVADPATVGPLATPAPASDAVNTSLEYHPPPVMLSPVAYPSLAGELSGLVEPQTSAPASAALNAATSSEAAAVADAVAPAPEVADILSSMADVLRVQDIPVPPIAAAYDSVAPDEAIDNTRALLGSYYHQQGRRFAPCRTDMFDVVF